MDAFLKTLTAMGAFALALFVFSWLGYFIGKQTVRRFPSVALALHLANSFFRLNPPPPPTAETIAEGRDDEAAGDPPKT